MLSIVVPLSLATLACVAWIQYRVAVEGARDVGHLIREGIREKGRMLTTSHALALQGLVADNAFGDVQALIARAVDEDPDVIYGLFLASDGTPWSYVSPTTPADRQRSADLEGWRSLRLPADVLMLSKPMERDTKLFSQQIVEFASPVQDGEELLGTVIYGLSTDRMRASLLSAQRQATQTLQTTLLLLGGLALLNIVLGVVLISRASEHISRPLATLTEAANTIAQGRRDVRATVTSNDELEVLAGAFNQMLEANQCAFEQLEETTHRALEAARLKSEFLANMSHEIRTPMNGIMGMSKLMLQMPLDNKLRRYAETIDASATALLTIVNDVLDFSKMEASKYVIQAVPFEPRLVIQDVIELLASRANDKGMELVYRVAPNVPESIVGDPDRFRQILNNLVGNAVKFTEHGEVFVDIRIAEESATEVLLHAEVRDTGIGIADKDTGTIFEAFSQVDGTLVRRHGGTGLGLAISKRLVEMMGGSIGVWSRPGFGSQFWFTIRAGRAQSEAASPRAQQEFHTGKRALVVEASHRWREVIGEHMRSWGLECECFQSGDQAVERLKEMAQRGQYFDVALIGTQTGAMGLREVIQALQRSDQKHQLPLVLLYQLGKATALGEFEPQVIAQLPKPLRMSDLYNSLQDAFSGQRKSELPVQVKAPRRALGEKILVVDDNRVNQFVAVEQLMEAGYDTDVANHGEEAVAMVKRGAYALVLMDCQMPVMDGYTATREIRKLEAESGKHQLIIALTAHAMADERARVLAAGMDDYLSKPLRANALERMLGHYLSPKVDPVKEARREGPAEAQAGVGRDLPVSSPAVMALEGAFHGSSSVRRSENDGTGAVVITTPEAGAVLAPDVSRSVALIQTCLREMPRQLSAVVESFERNDAIELRAAAHKLKGSAMAMAADKMAEVAETLQHSAEERRLESAASLIASLQEQFELVEAALRAELAEKECA